MPLFMFISGYVSYSSNYKWTSIKRRFIQLIVPFVAWSMLSMTLSGNYSLNWLTRPDTSLWFLWVLFWIGCVHLGLSKLSKQFQIYEEIIILIACIVFLGLLFINKFSFGFHLFAWYLPFYCAGAITRKHQSNLFYKLVDFKWLFLLLFIILGYFWMRQESPTFINTNSTAIIYFYKFLVGFIGCYTFILFAQMYNYKVLYICELGGMTLGIYAIHQFVIKFLIESHLYDIDCMGLWGQICSIFFMTLILTVFSYQILSHIPFLSQLFLGKKH